jgi:tRNA(Ile)-lysidine synthetase-like protein
MRQVIQSLRKGAGQHLPITSDILIAVSGGVDSMALATLLIRYGRRVIPNPQKQITLLHLNHHWRAEESHQDEEFVKAFAQQENVKFLKFDLKPLSERVQKSSSKNRESPEEHARRQRKEIYKKLTAKKYGYVFTAHHADDVVETLLWRFFTGALDQKKQKQGIRWLTEEKELRPLLWVTKETLKWFLNEEGQTWREDSTNQNAPLLRAQMRQKLIPEIKKTLPGRDRNADSSSLRLAKAANGAQFRRQASLEWEKFRSITPGKTCLAAKDVKKKT